MSLGKPSDSPFRALSECLEGATPFAVRVVDVEEGVDDLGQGGRVHPRPPCLSGGLGQRGIDGCPLAGKEFASETGHGKR